VPTPPALEVGYVGRVLRVEKREGHAIQIIPEAMLFSFQRQWLFRLGLWNLWNCKSKDVAISGHDATLANAKAASICRGAI
jgi:hypothetical protein